MLLNTCSSSRRTHLCLLFIFISILCFLSLFISFFFSFALITLTFRTLKSICYSYASWNFLKPSHQHTPTPQTNISWIIFSLKETHILYQISCPLSPILFCSFYLFFCVILPLFSIPLLIIRIKFSFSLTSYTISLMPLSCLFWYQSVEPKVRCNGYRFVLYVSLMISHTFVMAWV